MVQISMIKAVNTIAYVKENMHYENDNVVYNTETIII